MSTNIQAEELYRSLVENTPDVVTRWNRELKLIFANKALEEKIGVPKETVYGKNKTEMGLPDAVALPWMEKIGSVFKTGKALTYYSPFPQMEGPVFFDIRLVPEKNKKGQVETVLCIARDISPLEKAAQELKESRERFQAAIDVSPITLGILKSVREEGRITDFCFDWISKSGQSLLKKNIMGKNMCVEFSFDKNSNVLQEFIHTAETGKPVDLSYLHKRGKSVVWLRWRAVKFDDGLFVSIEDITERKNAEFELLDLRLKQQREVLNAIIQAQEEERERIGEALHDGVAQLMYGVQTRLQTLQLSAEVDKKNMREILSILSDAINDTRRLSFELVPAVLKDYGIEVALKTLFQRIIKDTPKISLQVKGLHKRLPEKLEFTIYRVVQELVNNILRHSGATEASIGLGLTKKELSLVVVDNGVGMREPAEERLHKGIGLQSIKNRIRLLEGTFKIQSSSVAGTAIYITIPVE